METDRNMEKNSKNRPHPDVCKSTLAPIQDALYVLNGKWKLPILVAMLEGNTRFGDIRRVLDKIAPKVLSHELKELELHGFITRTVIDSTPVVVNYELTDYSDSLEPVIAALRDWGVQHRERIVSQMNKESN